MAASVIDLEVSTGLGPDADDAELEERTIELRQELLALDVQDVRRPPGGPAPEGARAGGETALLATLLVTAGQQAITLVVGTVAQWLSRGKDRTARLKIGDDSIELTDVSAADQRRMLEAFLARHVESSQ